MSIDELFEMRNNFYIGNYQAAINEGEVFAPSRDEQTLERDVLVQRCYVAQMDYASVIEEVDDDDPIPVQSVKQLAVFLSNNGSKRAEALQQVLKWLSEGEYEQDETLKTVAATMYTHLGDYEKALSVIHDATGLELRAFMVQLYLSINRMDYALKEVKEMQKTDDVATLTQLCQAWVFLMLNEQEKVEEAVVIFTELVQKWSPTPMLLNGLAVCHLHRKHEGTELKLAEKEAMLALEKGNKNPDTLINIIAIQLHAGKSPDQVNRFVKKVSSASPEHPWVEKVNQFTESFDRCAKSYTPSVSS